MWERFSQQHEVGLYVRRFCEAEELESKVNLSTLVRQMADSLGLTTPGMRANRWRILREEDAAVRPAVRGRAASGSQGRSSSRSRLTVVSPSSDGE